MMKKMINWVVLCVAAVFTLSSCDKASDVVPEDNISQEVLTKISQLGFSTEDILTVEEGYVVEGDIYLPEVKLSSMSSGKLLAVDEQYRTDTLVRGLPRVITLYMPTGSNGYGSVTQQGLDKAIYRYNAENLQIMFQRVSSPTNADIVFKRLSAFNESRGVIGWAGFPTYWGDPCAEITLNGTLYTIYGLSVDAIASIIAHEMGHCIGFRHTDYFDRSISCGNNPVNEGPGDVGVNHIPGTPTGASLASASWMLACFDGTNRPFNNADKVALDYLY